MRTLMLTACLLILGACSLSPNDDVFNVRQAMEPARTYAFGYVVD